MKQKIFFVWALFSFVAFTAKCQDYIYSLYQLTPVIYNPASVAIDNEASISFLSRKTNIGPGTNYSNNVFTGKYPLVRRETGRRFGGVGVHFMQKDAGMADLMKSVTAGLSLAYNLPIAREQFFSFGLQSSYYNSKTSLESLTSGNQWLTSEFRFDPGAPLGEPITQTNVNYFSVNAGAMWYLNDKETSMQKAFAGITAFNLNKPNQSFFKEENRMPVGLLFNAGAVAYHTSNYQLIPQVLHQYDNFAHATNVIVSNKVFFSNNNPYDIIQSGNLELLVRYNLKKDAAFGMVFHQPGISFGFSYNTPLASAGKDQYFKSAFEFGIKLNRLVWKSEAKKVTITNPSGTKRNFDFNDGNQSNNNASPVQQQSDTDIIQKNIENYSKVSALQFELDKNFKFDFGKTELKDDAKAFLDDLYKLMEKNPEYKIEVIGHTDNVGKHLVNYKLSSGRARAVQDYLIKKGLSPERVRSKGMGDTQPVAPNDTDENRAKNRRVQFIIYVNR